MKDKQVLIRITEEQNEAIEEFAEDREYNKSEAVRKIVVSRLVGDGYLEDGLLLADGGEILNRIEAVEQTQQNRLDEIEAEIGEVSESVEGTHSELAQVLFLLFAVGVGILGPVALLLLPQPLNIVTAGIGTFVMVFAFAFSLTRKIYARR